MKTGIITSIVIVGGLAWILIGNYEQKILANRDLTGDNVPDIAIGQSDGKIKRLEVGNTNGTYESYSRDEGKKSDIPLFYNYETRDAYFFDGKCLRKSPKWNGNIGDL